MRTISFHRLCYYLLIANYLLIIKQIVIEEGEFRWREGEEPSLRDINLRIARGSLVAVVGSVGAGKSSLVNALLANVRKTKGSVTVSGTVAYCSQQAWMQNASVRNFCFFYSVFFIC